MSHSLTRREALAGIGAAGLAMQGRFAVAQPKAELVTKPIPSTGERLPVIGIGTARRFDVGTDEKDRAPIREVLQNLPKLGGRLVDTAPSYGNAEEVIGDILAELGNRDQIFLATKVGAGNRGVAAGVKEMEESLTRLRTDKLDLLMVHNLNGVREMLPVLREWKDKGRTRYIGMSTSFDRQYGDFTAIMERENLDFIQVDYAIDNRGAEERILPLAADRGMAVLTNLPFGRGRVFQAFGKKPLPDWATELGIETWAQFALKFLVSHPAVTVAIPGTARPDYLVDNLGAGRGPMPDAKTRERMADLIAGG
ncbi:MAG TPA: aldo/keto reductase [Xanthobacteraceae bacterium]|nr:aldo/keto reductase [Xanthobacteraceae bacterium]